MTEIDYEIRVDGGVQAATNSLAEAIRYFMQYQNDGERVELLKVETIKAKDNPGFDWKARALANG